MRSPLVRCAVPIALVAIAVLILVATQKIEARASSPYPIGRTIAFDGGLERLTRQGVGWRADIVPASVPLELPIRPGQTVGGLLSELDLENRDVNAIVSELSEFTDLRKLKPNDGYAVVYEAGSREVSAFELTLASRGRVRVTRGDDSWTGSFREFVRRTEVRVVAGELEGALESSIARGGGDPRLSVLLAQVFQWDLDFHRDLRLGDTFEIVYEKVHVDGSFTELGEILAVRYTNLGKTLEGYRFGDPAGYYDSEGRPLRKMFLRSPMRYSRITSRYSARRFHPVLKRYRPHYGVDYGAPTGTPVRVTSNGVVSFAGWDGGGGRTVKVRHPNGYLTAYLHLSGFGPGVSSGRRVTQGDTIGYVGSTGLSTGPHLDYRVQRHGKWIDPLSIKSVPADPVPVDRLEQFEAWRDAYRESLTNGEPTVDLAALRAEAASAEPAADSVTASASRPADSSGS